MGEELAGRQPELGIGNLLGGISLVAVVNHAQVVAGGGKRE